MPGYQDIRSPGGLDMMGSPSRLLLNFSSYGGELSPGLGNLGQAALRLDADPALMGQDGGQSHR